MNFFYETRENGITFEKRNTLNFRPHLHMQAEIVFILKGSTICHINGEEFYLHEGDAAIIYPNKIHSYREDNHLNGMLLIVEPADFPELKSMFKNREPVCPVIHKEELEQIGFFEALRFSFLEFHSGTDIIKKGSVLIVLGKLLSLLELREKSRGDNDIISDILNFCEKHYREPISLSDAAKALHISNGYLSHIFSGRLRMSFPDYIHLLRIKDACTLLKDSDASITEISSICGYSSLRTFNRAFLKHTGITPRKYRQL